MTTVIAVIVATLAIDVDLEERASFGIVDRTNSYRTQQELTPLKTNRELEKAAKYFARYLADQELEEGDDGLDHEADSKTPAKRAEEHGYEYCIVLENIAMHPQRRGQTAESLAKALAEGWHGSEHHRTNLLDPDVTDTAVAIARNEKTGRYYAVQMFGRPESARIEFTIDNKSSEEVVYEIDHREFKLKPGVARTHSYCRPPRLVVELDESGQRHCGRTVATFSRWSAARERCGLRSERISRRSVSNNDWREGYGVCMAGVIRWTALNTSRNSCRPRILPRTEGRVACRGLLSVRQSATPLAECASIGWHYDDSPVRTLR